MTVGSTPQLQWTSKPSANSKSLSGTVWCVGRLFAQSVGLAQTGSESASGDDALRKLAEFG